MFIYGQLPVMLRNTSLFILILGLLSSGQAFAQDDGNQSQASPLPAFDQLKRTDTGKIERILDGLTIELKDKRIIRLSSLDIPGFVYPEPSEISLSARKYLQEKLPKGTDVLIYQTKTPKVGRVNRMDQILAHVVTQDETIWAQQALVHEGLARVAPTPTNSEMIEELYQSEGAAVKDKKGLWADEAYPIKNEENAGDVIGQFTVIEGTIEKTASVKNNIYLNFGKDWRTDFTIMVKPAVRKKLARAEIDPLSLSGKAVQVRGWLRDYNGPLIELNDPASLRLLPASAQGTTVESQLKN